MENPPNGPLRGGRGGRGRRGGRGFANRNDNWRNNENNGRRNWRNRNEEEQSQNDDNHQQNRYPRNNRNNFNHDRNYNGNRNQNSQPPRQMGFRFIENLLADDDIETVIFTLSNDKKGFGQLLAGADKMSNDTVVLVVKLLWKICNCTFIEPKKNLLQAALKSPFVNKLIGYINQISCQGAREKEWNKSLWKDTDDFWNNILNISKIVIEIMPTLACDEVKSILNTLNTFIPIIEKEHSIHISDEIKTQAGSLLYVAKQIHTNLERKREMVEPINTDQVEDPPDDFREINIMPSVAEVTIRESPFLRPNVIRGPYQDANHYLDVQFRLLREDFVAPLRDGICQYMNKDHDKRIQDIRIYKKIQFLNRETVSDQHCYKIQFDFSKTKKSFTYENSRRFMFGSLVCFTADNFKSLLFGKIVQRDIKLLENGQLIVGFNEEVVIKDKTDYLMVESSVYFEPYYQVLNVLKGMQPENFPMEKYIIYINTRDSYPPDYLLKIDPVFYEIEDTKVWPLNWPEKTFYGLNDAQLTAFKAALSQEFCIIQGPPGTGKTFLGLKIAGTLLSNAHAWYKNTPILVICFTNHALDQFLEGLLPVTDKILRVGGQSKNEKLLMFNIKNKRSRSNDAICQKSREVKDALSDIQSISNILKEIELNESVVSFTVFRDIINNYRNTWFSKASQDHIRKWLLGGRNVEERRMERLGDLNELPHNLQNMNVNDDQEENVIEEIPEIEDRENDRLLFLDDIFDDVVIQVYRPMIHLKDLQVQMRHLRNELQHLDTSDISELRKMLEYERITAELWELNNQYNYVKWTLSHFARIDQREPPEFVDLQKPERMTAEDRWRLYFHWLEQYKRLLVAKRDLESVRFRELFRVYNQMKEMEDTQVMKKQLVVGMTTTGAARLQSSLQALKSPIVIVEEAAEVLEAHIVATLTNNCKHLILIGDHQQLKPSAANYKIETKYKLGISLFERMVINNIQCHTLNIQHRMRPEISKLICPTIYPNLQDHPTTLERPPILGIEKCVFFTNHKEQEQLCGDASKKNTHEAKFLIYLARHLILNGYKPENITILAAYLGQMFEMQREKKKHQHLLQDVRISVLDNYQGEESDIILLSLVRSNAEKKIGFLKIENRVCVALSRARDGFYLMGNMDQLCDSSEIWPKIRATLEEQHSIGPYLTLRCQVHKHKITHVEKAEDFMNIIEGGCDILCEKELSCGHICKRFCHIQDRDHILYNCLEECERFLCDEFNHKCQKKCYEECGPCWYPVSRQLDCGHTVAIDCNLDPAKFNCMVLVETKLPCDHVHDKPCSVDPVKFKCPSPCDARVEPCGHACNRSCHIREDPDHLKYKCCQPCARPRIGCNDPENPQHVCSRRCFDDCEPCVIEVKKSRTVCPHVYKVACSLNVDDIECQKPCTKNLPCGHKCKNKCCEPCGPCAVKVDKKVPDCNHLVKIKCCEEPNRSFCNGNCPRLLPCGHNCKKRCRELCTQDCKEMVECNIATPCGHRIKLIKCSLINTTDPDILRKHCTQECNKPLKCGHNCSGTCGECLQGRIHKRCAEKCGVPLVCNHECPIPCREACKPCEKPCDFKCKHSKCKKKCGEPCTPCKQPCTRHCKHQKCPKWCGQICSIPPCYERCEKTLKCGHPCVGFCGDVCPSLCRICNNEELTEIFFGTEDEEDAIFVMLNDCKHVLESEGLEQWLAKDEDEIKSKVCPKCKTNITTTERYSHYVKQAMKDVINVKSTLYGSAGENKAKRLQLGDMLRKIKSDFQHVLKVSKELQLAVDKLNSRLQEERANRRQAINKMELNAIESKIQLIDYILDNVGKSDKATFEKSDRSIEQICFILSTVMRDEDHITDQEIEDVRNEILRLRRIAQYDKIKKSPSFRYYIAKDSIKMLVSRIEKNLDWPQKFNESLNSALQNDLQALNKEVASFVSITEAERREIAGAIRSSSGRWYKCPNGHPYIITECGQPMQIARCPVENCRAQIGGQNHIFLPNQARASEFY